MTHRAIPLAWISTAERRNAFGRYLRSIRRTYGRTRQHIERRSADTLQSFGLWDYSTGRRLTDRA